MTARHLALALASALALSVGLACQPAEQTASVTSSVMIADAGPRELGPESVELEVAEGDGGLGKCAEWGYQRGMY